MTDEALNIEKQFISLLLRNKDLVEDYVESQLTSEHFDPAFISILYAIEDSYHNDVLLTRKSFLDFISHFVSKKREQARLELNFGQISFTKADRHDYPMLKKKILNGYLSRSVYLGIQEFNKDRENRGEQYAVQELAQRMTDLSLTSEDNKKKILYQDINTMIGPYLDRMTDLREGRIPDKEFIHFGIEELDKTSGIGLAPGTLTLLCGDVGGYKSTMMLNIGAHVWWNEKHNVLHIPLEMPHDLMLTKLVSRQTNTPFDLLKNPSEMSDKQNEFVLGVKKKWLDHESSFWIMDSYEDRTKVSVIRHMIERNLDLFKPRLVIVDYIANLRPDNANQGRNDLEIGEMLKDLRHMGKPGVVHDEGFAILSGAQLGREALKRVRRQGGDKASFHSEDIRGSHEYSADADTMYAQFIDDKQPDDKLIIYCVKSRYGKKTFPNGTAKAFLELKPELSLIRSQDAMFSGDDRDEVLQKAMDDESQDLDFESPAEQNNDDIDVDATFNKEVESGNLGGDNPDLW
jgi:replicative DNA helicase